MKKYWPGTGEGPDGVELVKEWPWNPSFGKAVMSAQASQTTGLTVEETWNEKKS
jgi:hypothetical protein